MIAFKIFATTFIIIAVYGFIEIEYINTSKFRGEIRYKLILTWFVLALTYLIWSL